MPHVVVEAGSENASQVTTVKSSQVVIHACAALPPLPSLLSLPHQLLPSKSCPFPQPQSHMHATPPLQIVSLLRHSQNMAQLSFNQSVAKRGWHAFSFYQPVAKDGANVIKRASISCQTWRECL
uniref:Uncharacterized protein n=1 Tax=Haptolina brevifila TaxID=156173 RepID=A0A7S2BNJ8_9EUKA|mmetsp:Transcript_14867/g.29900  ORF Transcript_14867/g.29900 Transcript_14867/m.29900 type:complete len:124 (+) Transcript_14867:359-730(+)